MFDVCVLFSIVCLLCLVVVGVCVVLFCYGMVWFGLFGVFAVFSDVVMCRCGVCCVGLFVCELRGFVLDLVCFRCCCIEVM